MKIDKHHVADLAAAGIATVPTRFVEPGDDLPPLDGGIVVKPTISVGGRLTGRFGPVTHEEARRLIARHHAEGRAAMVALRVPAARDGRGHPHRRPGSRAKAAITVAPATLPC